MDTKALAKSYKEYGISIRRTLHQNPELGGQEFQTAALIESELDKIGVPHKRVAATNVVATITGARPGKTIGLRADMDALPVQEENDVEYRSQNSGVMHACGHDGHTASLLTAAKILVEKKDELCGTVKLLFQSAEENGTGAKELVDSGEIDGLDGVFGIHIWNDVEHGKVSVTAGEAMASAIEFRVYLEGKGGHGSASYKAVDATVPLASLVMNLQTLVSMEFDPLSDIVLTIGRIFSGPNAYIAPGGAYNIVSGESYLEGTVRVFNDKDSDLFKEKIQRLVDATAKMFGVKATLYYHPHCASVINDEKMARQARETCIGLWGQDVLDHELSKVMAGEDFGWYRTKVPSMFVFVGGRNEEKLPCYPHHNCRFNIDEDSIEQAASLYAQYALDYLREK